MNNINYNHNQRFYDFTLSKQDLNTKCVFILNTSQEQFEYFISKLNDNDKQNIQSFDQQHLKDIVFKKRLDNLHAIQNGVISENGIVDGVIKLQYYKSYYHLIFEYDIDKIQQIKNILKDKYDIKNVNLYQYDQKRCIYIFDHDSNFESKINSPLFSNLNNRINNYKKENLIQQPMVVSGCFVAHLCSKSLQNKEMWLCDDMHGIQLFYFNNLFDQNWYNLFCKNMKIFLDNQIK